MTAWMLITAGALVAYILLVVAVHYLKASGEHRAAQAEQNAEDERFWAHEATIARKDTWDRPPSDLFPEIAHEPPAALMEEFRASLAPGGSAGGSGGQPGLDPWAGLPPAQRAWPSHKAPLTGDICELPHPGRVPVAALQAALALGHLMDTVKGAADDAYLAERPELAPGHGYSDDTGSFAALGAEWDREDAS